MTRTQSANIIPDSTKPASDAYDFFQANIAVNVGEPAITFRINPSILCTSFGYFKSALSDQKSTDNKEPITLPQHEPAAFNLYLNWLHRGGLFINHRNAKAKLKGSEEASRESFWCNILACYFLGNKLQDVDFKDALVDAALLSMLGDDDGVTWFPGRRIRQRLYEHTSPRCCMRRLFVHIAASLTNVKELVHEDDPLSFRQELQRELTSGKDDDTYEVGIACSFHEHAPGEENCYRARK